MKNYHNFPVFLILLVWSASLQSQVTAQWRGTDRKGIYDEKNLLKKWPANGPGLLWSVPDIGNGYGAPAITSDRIYITGEQDSTCFLYAFNLKGKLIWKSDCGREWVKSYPGSRSTPTIAGDLIYVCSGLGNIFCVETATGKKKWSLDMIRDLQGQFTMFGHSESPLIDGDMVFITPGGKNSNILALNRFNGKVLWVCSGKGERPGYNSPLLIKLAERDIFVTFTAYTLLGIDAKTGNVLWTHDQDNTPVEKRELGTGDTHSNTVYYENGFIYYIAGDGNGAVKLELSPDGTTISQVWRNKDIDNYMGGFIKNGDYIYSCLSEKKELVSLDAATGKIAGSIEAGTGTIIFADGLLYYYNQKGDMDLVRPNKGKLDLVSSFRITAGTKEHFSHPVIHNGTLYLRHGKVLLAYDIKVKEPK
jgi:outer membrane protein assembly factor BamB